MAKEGATECGALAQIESSPKTARRPAKGLGSKSPVFEAAYARFMEDTFALDILHVARDETETHRTLTIAGAYRLRVDKKTSRLSQEHGSFDAEENETWTTRSFRFDAESDTFLKRPIEWRNMLEAAWRRRLAMYVPTAQECFPPEQYATYDRESGPQVSLEAQLHLAVKRRVGSGPKGKMAGLSVCKAVWHFLLDPAVARLSIAFFGSKANFANYNLVAARRAEFEARHKETPHLALVMGRYVAGDVRYRSGRVKLPPDLLVRARDSLFTIQTPGEAPQPLPPASWRYLAACKAPTVLACLALLRGRSSSSWGLTGQQACEAQPDRKERCHLVLGVLAACQTRPPHSFVKWLGQNIECLSHARATGQPEPETLPPEALTRFIRLAAMEATSRLRKRCLKRFIKGDLALAFDWMRVQLATDGAGVIVPRNATWASIMRAQALWHANREAREAAERAINKAAYEAWLIKRDATAWLSAVDVCEISGHTFTPLVCGKDLRVEGNSLDHCVGSYVEDCARGNSRIFSLASATERATVEIACHHSKWRAQQVFGFENSACSDAAWKAARQLAQLYTQRERKSKPAKSLEISSWLPL